MDMRAVLLMESCATRLYWAIDFSASKINRSAGLCILLMNSPTEFSMLSYVILYLVLFSIFFCVGLIVFLCLVMMACYGLMWGAEHGMVSMLDSLLQYSSQIS